MDGRAWTAKELAFAAGVSAQTTSGHLARLVAGNLLAVTPQGRHRYYRLAGPAVARAVEALMALSLDAAPRHRPKTRIGAELAAARTCYDHLAGRLGVAIHDALMARGALVATAGGYELSASASGVFESLGIDPGATARGKRSLARPCLDWSERRFHLAGSLARALACRCSELGWIERQTGSRAVRLTQLGARELRDRLGVLVCDDPSTLAA
jgi:hypothetical protein